MKKVFFAIAILFAISATVRAQGDTVYIDLSDSNYYSDIKGWAFDSILSVNQAMYNNEIYAELRFTNSPLVVYGIVISAITPYYMDPYRSYDTSTYSGNEQTVMYKPGADGSMTLLGNGSYNTLAPTPYFLPSFPVALAQRFDTLCLPLYETYFDDVAVVTDSFYIGSTTHGIFVHNTAAPDAVTDGTRFACRLFWQGYYSDPTVPFDSLPYSKYKHCRDFGSTWSMTPGLVRERYSLICFPILTPDPNRDTIANPYHYPWDTVSTDTTHVDTTHNGISAGLLERYVNVYPTVADGGTVTVLSSFHLEGVEVYDAAGRMLSRQPASGVAATVDVSQLPAGSYVLRINTVSGSTAKKFLKR